MAYVIKVKGKNSYWVQDVGFRRFVPEDELEERQTVLKYKSKAEAEKDLIGHLGVLGKERIFKRFEIVKESAQSEFRQTIREEIIKIMEEETKLKEVHYTGSDLNILYSDIANFVELEYKKFGEKLGVRKPLEMYDLLNQLFDSPKVTSKLKK